jgi:hypothetical protein
MLPVNATLEKIVSEHPVGAETTAYYNPEKASEACLVPGTSNENPLAVAYLTSGGFFLVGVFTAVLAAAKKRRVGVISQSM